MPMTDIFRDFLGQIAIGEGTPVIYNNANAHIGVGDSGASLDAVSVKTQTDLLGTNKLRKPMRVGYPTRANNVLTFSCRFEESEALWNFLEMAVFNAAIGGIMMCRFDPGETTQPKPGNEIWDYTVEITLAHGAP